MKGILGEKLEITYYAPAYAVSVFKRCCVRLSVCSRGSARGSINAVRQRAKNAHRRINAGRVNVGPTVRTCSMLVLHDLIVGYSGHRHKLGQAARLKPLQYFCLLNIFVS